MLSQFVGIEDFGFIYALPKKKKKKKNSIKNIGDENQKSSSRQ